MKIHRLQTLTLAVAILASLPATYALAQNDSGTKQSMKNAGTDTKNAAKDTGHGIKQGSKKVYHKTKRGTKKVARKVEGKPTQTTPPQ